ncbi:hypothetical protein [Minwuia sp.]|uniref:hypothetical protein n=1 Tax=Minwuia sp. TaxID=2493630 RepID=UPI003A95ACF2
MRVLCLIAGVVFPLVLAACGGGEPLPPPEFDEPVLHADGTLTGVRGVDGRHWSLVDRDLRRGTYWYSFMNRLTGQCPEYFPEHADWLGEVNLLLQRATGQAVRRGIEMEDARLQTLAEGADRATVALQAMSVAEVDVAGIVAGWTRSATGRDVGTEEAWIGGCSLLFDRDRLRGLIRNSALPMADYFARMKAEHPAIYATVPEIEGITRRLEKI